MTFLLFQVLFHCTYSDDEWLENADVLTGNPGSCSWSRDTSKVPENADSRGSF